MAESAADSLDLSHPKTGTRGASAYYQAGFATVSVLRFFINTILVSDWTVHVLDKVLEDMDSILEGQVEAKTGPLVEGDPLDMAAKEPGTGIRFLKRHNQMFLQMFFARLVDNFQVYVMETIRAALARQPKILASSEPQLSLEYAFQFATLDEMIEDVIERKVSDLSYQGLPRLREWCGARGIPLVISDNDAAALNEAIVIRNVIAHHRGMVDARYLRNSPSPSVAVGSLRELSIRQVFDTFALLNRVVRETDKAVMEKFDLEAASIVVDPRTSESNTGKEQP
jgi:hypothetical protein